MKKIITSLFIIAIVCIVTNSCNPSDGDTHEIAFEIVETDNGKTFQAEINDQFNIALNEYIGGAEVWTINKLDSSKISLEQRTSRDRSCTNCDGGSLTRVFRFKCLQKGLSDLELRYFDDTLKATINIQ